MSSLHSISDGVHRWRDGLPPAGSEGCPGQRHRIHAQDLRRARRRRTKAASHRDLKPANIMIDGRGQVRVTRLRLAALAPRFRQRITSGTPALVAGAKRAKEVTTRSDIIIGWFARGARKNRRKRSAARRSGAGSGRIHRALDLRVWRGTQGRPSSRQRCHGAARTATPIAAAIAAGETPSPERSRGSSPGLESGRRVGGRKRAQPRRRLWFLGVFFPWKSACGFTKGPALAQAP